MVDEGRRMIVKATLLAPALFPALLSEAISSEEKPLQTLDILLQVPIDYDLDYDKLTDKDKRIKPYIPLVVDAGRKHSDIYPVHPLLMLALIKQESSFDQYAISWCGAAGAAQLMVGTARELGLNVEETEAYKQGWSKQGASARAYKRFEELNSALKKSIKGHYSENGLVNAESIQLDPSITKERDIALITSVLYHEEAKRFFRSNKKTLLQWKEEGILEQKDERFDIEKAVEVGLQYLAQQLKQFKGDIRVALSAYNGGPGNTRKSKGIYANKETVGFQNRVFRYFLEYLETVYNVNDIRNMIIESR